MTDTARERKGDEVKSAARVLEVLELLGQDGARLSLAEMASAMAVPKSSLHAVLRTMHGRRWVDVDPSGTRYSLGLKALLTGTAYLAGDDVASLAGPVLDTLAEETGEAVHLGRLDGTHIVYLAKRESRHALRMYSAVGRGGAGPPPPRGQGGVYHRGPPPGGPRGTRARGKKS
ncbi:IclR family transcriptional regulator, partial [Streptomyces sp. NPDC056161]|uniref:IclR family transcriptional regulator n=1 Tax=Streptomyces sp. NPDC056161 TaxID=3345732 RepID=UPI0035DF673A